MPFAPEKIRNVAFVGHRGSGKTSLAEALLFQAGAVTRLGSVADGTTVSDNDEDEKRRTMSISGSLLHAEHEGHKLNIFDAPGDPSFVADALGALRVVEGALFTVSGVAGVEVMTSRLWRRCDELEQSRVVFINHLDRDRADFAAALASIQEQLSPRCVAIAIPIGSEKDFRGVIDVLHMVAYEDAGDGSREAEPGPIPADMVDEAATWRERLVEAVVEVSDDLTAKYLDGEEISPDELREALHAEVLRGELFPVACGSATKNEGTHALLDLIVEGVPAPSENFIAARSGDDDVVLSSNESSTAVYAFKTVADAHVGRINFVRVFSGTLHADVQLVNGRTGTKERIGQVLEVQGKEHHPVNELGPGDIGAVPKLKDVLAGDVLAERPMIVQGAALPAPIVSVAVEPKVRGEDEKMVTALRRLAEEDPTLRVSRDERTSELLVSGLSQMHIEVTVERVKRRFGVEIVTHPPAGAVFRGDPQEDTRACALQEADRRARAVRRLPYRGRAAARTRGLRVRRQDRGRRHPAGLPTRGRQGHPGDDARRRSRGLSGHRRAGHARRRLLSLRRLFRDGIPDRRARWPSRRPTPRPTLCCWNRSCPSRSRRPPRRSATSSATSIRAAGALSAWIRWGTNTVIRAEVPMSEMLSYAPDLTSLTGGRGDYAMTLARYEEVPAHVSQRLIADLQREREAAKA